MKKIISYSLWGNNPRYTIGAIVNAQQVSTIYPGWTTRFYCGRDVPHTILEALEESGAEIISMAVPGDKRGMFWRFYALSDSKVSHVIIRDTDSRLTFREYAAVTEWINSGLPGHIMRDHPHHNMPIMGGMWGCIGGLFKNICTEIDLFSPQNKYNQDQIFLAQYVYPKLIKHGCIVHDEFYHYEQNTKNFPTQRINYEFVGEVINPDGTRDNAWKDIKKYEKNPLEKMKILYRKYKYKNTYFPST